MDEPDQVVAEGEPDLAWTAHPLMRRRLRGAITLAAILTVAVVLGVYMRSPFWGAFAAMVLVLSLEGFYLPTRYRLDSEGIQVRKAFSRSSMPWEKFRRVYEDGNGLTLSPYRHRSVLEPYRSARLLFDGGEAEAVKAAVRRRLPEETEWIMPRERTFDARNRP